MQGRARHRDAEGGRHVLLSRPEPRPARRHGRWARHVARPHPQDGLRPRRPRRVRFALPRALAASDKVDRHRLRRVLRRPQHPWGQEDRSLSEAPRERSTRDPGGVLVPRAPGDQSQRVRELLRGWFGLTDRDRGHRVHQLRRRDEGHQRGGRDQEPREDPAAGRPPLDGDRGGHLPRHDDDHGRRRSDGGARGQRNAHGSGCQRHRRPRRQSSPQRRRRPRVLLRRERRHPQRLALSDGHGHGRTGTRRPRQAKQP